MSARIEIGRDAQCLSTSLWLGDSLVENEDGTVTLSAELLVVLLNIFFMLFGAVWVLSMQAGFALLEAGSVRMKNTKSILIKNTMDACIGAVLWYLMGYALAYSSGSKFSGLTWDSMHGCMDHANWFFTWSFAATSATILSGAVAERCQFSAYLVFTACLTGIIHPIVAHWAWTDDGWLSAESLGGNGFIDAAGGGVVHTCGGTAALVAAWILGARHGQDFDETNKAMAGHSSVLATLGTFMLWVGWYGFNMVSGTTFLQMTTVARVAVNTTITATVGGLTSTVLQYLYLRIYDLGPINNGILGGLVSSCATAHVVTPYLAIPVGIAAGAVYFFSAKLLRLLKVDDPLEAVAVHMSCGLLGCLLAGLLASPDYINDPDSAGLLMGGGAQQLGVQAAGVAAIIAWSGLMTAVCALVLKWLRLLRIPLEDELSGMDRASHGGLAYTRNGEDGSIRAEIKAIRDTEMYGRAVLSSSHTSPDGEAEHFSMLAHDHVDSLQAPLRH